MLDAGNWIAVAWRRAGGNQDIARAHVRPIGKFNRVRVDKYGAAFDDLDAGFCQSGAVSGFEPRDLTILVGDQRRPVERCMRHRPAEARGIFEFAMKPRGVDQKLLWHAAADHAGAAEPVFLGDHDARSVISGNASGAHAARPAADHEEIDIILGHIVAISSDTSSASHISCPRFFISSRILEATSSESLSAQLLAEFMLSSAAFGSSAITLRPSGDW